MIYNSVNTEDFAKSIALPWWGVQALAWLIFCILSFLSLTLWYGNPRWLHVWHIALQAISGAVLTWPLARLLPFAGRGSIVRRILAHLVIVATIAFLWNIFRMATFDAMLTAPNIWSDFGGWYFTALLIFGLWVALYYVTLAYSAIAVQRSEAELERVRRIEAESLSREAQMKMLRYQVNPHFLFNTLNSISALVKTDRSDQARRMISQLSHFLRLSLENDGVVNVSVSEEIETLQLYLEIEKVRYGDRLTTQIDVDPQISDAQVPALILQPLFENALQHAVAGRVSGGTVRLTGRKSGDDIVLRICDSGDQDHQSDIEIIKKGIGLSNTEARMRTHFGDSGRVDYARSDLGGFEVSLTCPYIPTTVRF